MYALSNRKVIKSILQTLPITDERPHLSVSLFLSISFSIEHPLRLLSTKNEVLTRSNLSCSISSIWQFFLLTMYARRVDGSLKNLGAYTMKL